MKGLGLFILGAMLASSIWGVCFTVATYYYIFLFLLVISSSVAASIFIVALIKELDN